MVHDSINYSVNHKPGGWYWCLAGDNGVKPYTAAGCIWAGKGCAAWLASSGLAELWCAGGGKARLESYNVNGDELEKTG